MKIWELKTPGTIWATPGLLRDLYIYLYAMLRYWLFRPSFLSSAVCWWVSVRCHCVSTGH